MFCSDACLRAAKGNPAAHTADVCRSHALNGLHCSVTMPTQHILAMLQISASLSVAVTLGWTCPLLTCRVLSKADPSGLEEEDVLSLRLLAQAQALSAATKAHNAMHPTMQEAAQRQWTAFVHMQSAAPSGMPLYDQQRCIRLHERLQSASAAAGAKFSLYSDTAERPFGLACS